MAEMEKFKRDGWGLASSVMLFLGVFWCQVSLGSSDATSGVELFAPDAGALVQWKQALEDPEGVLSSWNLSGAGGDSGVVLCDTWTGVSCGADGRVQTISLDGQGLKGPLSPALGRLSSLQRLLVGENKLGGNLTSFPFELLGTLEVLDISNNAFTGPLPSTIGTLGKLAELRVDGNPQIGGTLPGAFSGLTLLRHLNLSRTSIQGTLPAGVAKMRNLSSLAMRDTELAGPFPAALEYLTNLEILDLGGNSLEGAIPEWVGQLALMRQLALDHNRLTGGIPVALANCLALTVIRLDHNQLSGPVPEDLIRQLSPSLTDFQASSNLLTGTLPPDFGFCLKLKLLNVSSNSLGGSIPPTLGNLTLPDFILDLSNNSFSGPIPPELANMPATAVKLASNHLTGVLPQQLCSPGSTFGDQLISLDFSRNRLEGPLPKIFSGCPRIEELDLSSNALNGTFPPDLGSLKFLRRLQLDGNDLAGAIPTAVGALASLQVLDLSSNRFTGAIPAALADISSLRHLCLNSNLISGQVPPALANFGLLKILGLANNGLQGPIPPGLGGHVIAHLDLSSNRLSGLLPPLPAGSTLLTLRLGNNSLSGPLPDSVVALHTLQILDLGSNSLSGRLPLDWRQVASSLTKLNLSANAFSGSVPPSLGQLARLQSLDLSNNHLDGSLPAGILAHFPASSFSGNTGLCGPPLPTCGRAADSPIRRTPHSSSSHLSRVEIAASAVGGSIVLLTIFGLTLALLTRRRQMAVMDSDGEPKIFFEAGLVLFKPKPNSRASPQSSGSRGGRSKELERRAVSFTMDEIQKSSDGFSREYIIGSGALGDVFRIMLLKSGAQVAVKRLSAHAPGRENYFRADKDFRAATEALGKIRHRHVAALLGAYSHPFSSERFLIYHYMTGGNLECQLSGGVLVDPRFSKWTVRARIAVGVGRAIQHLHRSCQPPMAHGNLKPSNILLDADMDAYVVDMVLRRLGSPAVASDHEQAAREDVFALGVVLLQLASGRGSSIDEVRQGGESWARGLVLPGWAAARLDAREAAESGDGPIEPYAESDEGEDSDEALALDPVLEFETPSAWRGAERLVRLGLRCAAREPAARPDIDEVVRRLESLDGPTPELVASG